MKPLPEKLEIKQLSEPVDQSICVPGSKSITNRALVLAALSARSGDIKLRGALRSEDTEVMIGCLRELGFDLVEDWERHSIRVRPVQTARLIPASRADLFVGNSGTTMRFLTAMVSLGKGTYRLDGVSRMRERPIQDLLDALSQLGVRAVSEKNNGCPPVIVEPNGLCGGVVRIRGDVSSQFLSGLMIAAAAVDAITEIVVEGTLVSRPYVDMTFYMLRMMGLHIEALPRDRFVIRGGGQLMWNTEYVIEPDASAASYFFAAAAIAGGRVSVSDMAGVKLQGDVRFVELLREMGCLVEKEDASIVVERKQLHGIDVDMNDISDTVMTLAVVACFAEGPTTIRNVAHIRHKETDRLHALATELRKIGATVEERSDGLRIIPGPLHGAEIETYQDHRMAMSLALVGLRIPGIVIKDPGCVAKTYPDFFADLEKLR